MSRKVWNATPAQWAWYVGKRASIAARNARRRGEHIAPPAPREQAAVR